MTEENIRHNVEKHFGKVDFELIEFSKYNQPVTYKCLHCGKVFTLKRLYINYKQMSNIEQLLVQRLSVTGVGLSGPKSQSPRNED